MYRVFFQLFIFIAKDDFKFGDDPFMLRPYDYHKFEQYASD